MFCHAKIGPAGLILAEKPAKTGPPGPLLLPKFVRPDRFWLPKMVPSCQNQSKITFDRRDYGYWESLGVGRGPQLFTTCTACLKSQRKTYNLFNFTMFKNFSVNFYNIISKNSP